MAWAVVAGDAGPVEGEDHRQAVEAHIEVGLVEGPAEERRIEGHHGPQPAHGHPGCRGHRLLLSDAHVEEAPWPAGTEGPEPSRPGHGGGNGHHPGVLLPDVDHGLAEGPGVARRCLLRHRGACHRVESRYVVEALLVVALRGRVAAAL